MWFLSPGTFRYNTGGVIGEKKRNADFLRFGKNLCFSENLGFSRQTSGFPSNPTNSSVSVSLGSIVWFSKRGWHSSTLGQRLEQPWKRVKPSQTKLKRAKTKSVCRPKAKIGHWAEGPMEQNYQGTWLACPCSAQKVLYCKAKVIAISQA